MVSFLSCLQWLSWNGHPLKKDDSFSNWFILYWNSFSFYNQTNWMISFFIFLAFFSDIKNPEEPADCTLHPSVFYRNWFLDDCVRFILRGQIILHTKNPADNQTFTGSHKVVTESGCTIVVDELEHVNSSLNQEEMWDVTAIPFGICLPKKWPSGKVVTE